MANSCDMRGHEWREHPDGDAVCIHCDTYRNPPEPPIECNLAAMQKEADADAVIELTDRILKGKNKLARARSFAAQAEDRYSDKYTGLMAALEKARADWEKENSLIVAEYERTKKAAEAADKELRAELVEFYKLTGEKKFDEHLSVRVLIKLAYELEKATEWAKNNAPYMLIADKSQFEKYAKDKKVSLDFVTKKDEPAGVVASVLPMIEDAQIAESRPERCPLCNSPDPRKHPAMQFEGEVEICKNPWHGGHNGPINARGEIIEQGAD